MKKNIRLFLCVMLINNNKNLYFGSSISTLLNRFHLPNKAKYLYQNIINIPSSCLFRTLMHYNEKTQQLTNNPETFTKNFIDMEKIHQSDSNKDEEMYKSSGKQILLYITSALIITTLKRQGFILSNQMPGGSLMEGNNFPGQPSLSLKTISNQFTLNSILNNPAMNNSCHMTNMSSSNSIEHFSFYNQDFSMESFSSEYWQNFHEYQSTDGFLSDHTWDLKKIMENITINEEKVISTIQSNIERPEDNPNNHEQVANTNPSDNIPNNILVQKNPQKVKINKAKIDLDLCKIKDDGEIDIDSCEENIKKDNEKEQSLPLLKITKEETKSLVQIGNTTAHQQNNTQENIIDNHLESTILSDQVIQETNILSNIQEAINLQNNSESSHSNQDNNNNESQQNFNEKKTYNNYHRFVTFVILSASGLYYDPSNRTEMLKILKILDKEGFNKMIELSHIAVNELNIKLSENFSMNEENMQLILNKIKKIFDIKDSFDRIIDNIRQHIPEEEIAIFLNKALHKTCHLVGDVIGKTDEVLVDCIDYIKKAGKKKITKYIANQQNKYIKSTYQKKKNMASLLKQKMKQTIKTSLSNHKKNHYGNKKHNSHKTNNDSNFSLNWKNPLMLFQLGRNLVDKTNKIFNDNEKFKKTNNVFFLVSNTKKTIVSPLYKPFVNTTKKFTQIIHQKIKMKRENPSKNQ